jgi:hypothetical protein
VQQREAGTPWLARDAADVLAMLAQIGDIRRFMRTLPDVLSR